MLDDEYFVSELKALQEKTAEQMALCMDSPIQINRDVCGKTAMYHLNCLLRGLHEEGDVYDLMADCAGSTSHYNRILKEEIRSEL